MAKFFYIARDKSGNKVTGAEESTSEDEFISRLQARGLVVINVLSAGKDGGVIKDKSVMKGRYKHKHFRVTSDDLVLLCRQLATLLGAGVTILKSLQIISRQVASRKL